MMNRNAMNGITIETREREREKERQRWEKSAHFFYLAGWDSWDEPEVCRFGLKTPQNSKEKCIHVLSLIHISEPTRPY